MSATLARRLIREAGTEYCDTVDLLAALIGNMPAAKALLARYGGHLTIMATASPADYMEVTGISPASAAAIKAAMALAWRLGQEPAMGESGVLRGTAEAIAVLDECFAGKQQEEFRVLLLNAKHHIIDNYVATLGTADRCSVHAREVFRRAIRENCIRVVLAHNHPSGDPTPSAEDIAITRDLVAAGKIIDIEILDHIIVGRRCSARCKHYVSFREEKLI